MSSHERLDQMLAFSKSTLGLDIASGLFIERVGRPLFERAGSIRVSKWTVCVIPATIGRVRTRDECDMMTVLPKLLLSYSTSFDIAYCQLYLWNTRLEVHTTLQLRNTLEPHAYGCILWADRNDFQGCIFLSLPNYNRTSMYHLYPSRKRCSLFYQFHI